MKKIDEKEELLDREASAPEETPEEEQPETAAVKASVKSLGAELQLGAEHATPVASVRVELYNGPVNRVLVNNATFGF